MKPAASKLIVLTALLLAHFVVAQDIQSLYDEAKEALMRGDYQTALDKISAAKAEIVSDPNLDPNGTYMDRLLPKIENTADSMAGIVKALEELYSSAQTEVVFPDLAPTREAVAQYSQQAKKASERLLAKRDSIFSSFELGPEYREALRNTFQLKQIEQLASIGIMDKLSEKFARIAGVLSDSIRAINDRYKSVESRLAQMKKSAASSSADRAKLEQRLAELSQERMNYVNTISEMLVGETTAENQQMRMVLVDQNIGDVFGNVIMSEIKRVQEITEVDSAGYRELMKGFERLQKYNQIFAKNNVSGDQSALLAKYGEAIKRIKVVEPGRPKPFVFLVIGLAVIGILLVILRMRHSSRKAKTTEFPPEPQSPPVAR